VFTDVRSLRQCPGCAAEPVIDRTALETTMTDLYGPRAGGQARVWNLTSFSLADLAYSMGERPPSGSALGLADPAEVQAALEAAHWVVFNLLSGSQGRYGAEALKILLDRHPDRLQGKQVIVFAFDVPYRLDATDLSKVDLFYALYSPSPSFVNTSARLLYQELAPEGDPPVSVAGVGYDLIEALTPDPQQTIGLSLRGQAGTGEPTTPEVGFSVGDTAVLHTSVILDHNGRVVADGTPVEFQITYPGETLAAISPATTVDGVAETTIRLDRNGMTTIRVTSEPARRSEIVQLDVKEGVPAFATVIAPSPVPSATVASAEATSSPTPEPAGAPSDGEPGGGGTGLPTGAWPLGMVTAALLGAAGFVWGRRRGSSPWEALRIGLLAATGSLLGFDYIALGLPGSEALLRESPYLALVVLSVLGAGAGLAAAVLWRRRDWAV
jgi:beta-N-acetylhexosaminidase